MPDPLTVEKQRFTFGASWKTAFKFDASKFYAERVEKALKATKAVDVVAESPSNKILLLLEAKDFRGYRIQNKRRLTQGELAEEVAWKVRDTVAALLGAGRSATSEFDSKTLLKRLQSEEKFVIVLWLEDDAAANINTWKSELTILSDRIKGHLKWLGPLKVHVLSTATFNTLPDLTVENLQR